MAGMPVRIADASVMGSTMREVRRACGVRPEQFSDMRLDRLLRSHSFNVAKTVDAVTKHCELANWFNASKAVSVEAEGALRSSRFRYIGTNKYKNPIIVLDWMYGQFAEVSGGVDTLLEAYVTFLNRLSSHVKSQRRDGKELEFIVITVGGPPDTGFIEGAGKLWTIDFPERVGSILFFSMQTSDVTMNMTTVLAGLQKATPMIDVKLVATSHELMTLACTEEGVIPNDVVVLERRPSAEQDTGSSGDSIASLDFQGRLGHVRRAKRSNSNCSTVDTDLRSETEPALTEEFANISQRHSSSPFCSPNLAPHDGDLRNLSLTHEPLAHLDWAGVSLQGTAHFLATFAEQSRLNAQIAMWRRAQWHAQSAQQATLFARDGHSDAVASSLHEEAPVKQGRSSKGVSGARRRKQKKLASKLAQSDDACA